MDELHILSSLLVSFSCFSLISSKTLSLYLMIQDSWELSLPHLLFILGVFMENDVFRLLLINGTTVFVVRYHVTEVFDLSLTIYFVSNV